MLSDWHINCVVQWFCSFWRTSLHPFHCLKSACNSPGKAYPIYRLPIHSLALTNRSIHLNSQLYRLLS